jgi:hypothetical protein
MNTNLTVDVRRQRGCEKAAKAVDPSEDTHTGTRPHRFWLASPYSTLCRLQAIIDVVVVVVIIARVGWTVDMAVSVVVVGGGGGEFTF